ncbi:MAG: hypothetical protein A2527_14520 [Candidatus Lambdaproteobacteria bacterium RIFOXYD2_FULL_50_16]|uniref:Uncharacterized protein n=1 Tax=Candidatus Lambdaproteobacteria bacterium RIFOXYD2_FULL_50_16 TaxID=1817772 RepID=A0A1F6G835_9PROT|nr:MAG: hypothetical protein A2527_14520 [Candidatus Lambdaproteobacteria bacterium RIFOXYD2_FULL_50_16]
MFGQSLRYPPSHQRAPSHPTWIQTNPDSWGGGQWGLVRCLKTTKLIELLNQEVKQRTKPLEFVRAGGSP